MDGFTQRLKAEAQRLGFPRAGVCEAGQPPHWDAFQKWLEAGYAGEMRYLPERRAAYRNPESVLAGAQRIVMLAMDYQTDPPVSPPLGSGRVSRYAWGARDYHDLIHKRLKQLREFVQTVHPTALVRGVVDTAPLLEHDFAQLAGLGWIGKHTLLLHPQAGSWFFLAALLTDLPLETDPPFATDHCGTCRACLDACPTDAFPEPYVLDATRCISYLTIELRGAIPRPLRPGLEDWVFGCDICQEVCPWNRRAPVSPEPDFRARSDLRPLELTGLFSLTDDAFRARFRRTPLWRTKRAGLLRNAAVVLGNRRSAAGRAALEQGLADEDATVRAACVWALRQYGESARAALTEHRQRETDPEVLTEYDS